ncbi:MAG: molybdopterin-dependent oxidoreductase [Spirochaetaceae bacterium]|nr:molybdopterin-dependent oxidoreductase [Spirochaetaceae bacterium]
MFVDDIFLQDQYFAVTVRSPSANCLLKDVRCPVPDPRYRLIRASDIPGKNCLAGSAVPVLAQERLCYTGEPVAILTGPDYAKLEELAACTVIETAPAAPPVFSMDSDGAEIAAQVMLEMDAFPKNVSMPKERPETNGADDSAAAAADGQEAEPALVSGFYRTGMQEHWYSEPHGAHAAVRDGGVIVYTATQWPNHVKQSVAEALALPVGAVSLKTAESGLHFDGKIWYPSLVTVHAALAAFIIKKPVKLMLTREEDFFFSPKRPETTLEFCSRLDRKGEPYETTVNVRAGFGSETFFAGLMLDSIARAAAGHYRLGRIRVKAEAVKTNLPPAGPFAGFGAAQGLFALERHIAKIADTVREEGSEWRGRHYNEKKLTTDELEKLIETLMEQSDYRRKWAAYELLRQRRDEAGVKTGPVRGIGLAAIAYGSGKIRYNLSARSEVPPVPVPDSPPLAAAIVELEIDRLDFSANVRCLCLSVLTGALNDKRAARRKLLQNSACALGWTTTEKLEYRDGRIGKNEPFDYRIPPPSSIPPVKLTICERSAAEENAEVIRELPYCVIPAAYLQALTQACDHHFQSIPVSARDIWCVLESNERRRQDARGEKEE